uniref:Uncharacterized protein n=2 Tax=Arion vulgaris TaxID=1028688 RepID=A0A0B7B5U8_9EUPU
MNFRLKQQGSDSCNSAQIHINVIRFIFTYSGSYICNESQTICHSCISNSSLRYRQHTPFFKSPSSMSEYLFS